jgi:hypothetical protein
VSGIQGQVLRVSQRREAAIYLRKGTLWVADFIDGDGEIVEATTWFRFNCGALSAYHAQRRMVRESAIPLSAELVDRIETLHSPTQPAKTTRPMASEDDNARSLRPRSAIARILRACSSVHQRIKGKR